MRRPVMRLSMLRTMKGMNGGGPDMTSLATEIPARLAQESPTSEGMTRLLPLVESVGRVNYVDVNYVDTEKCRTRSGRVRQFGGGPGGEDRGCGHCPHFGSRTGSDWCRTGPDSVCFGGSPVFARAGTRLESHLGHVFPWPAAEISDSGPS